VIELTLDFCSGVMQIKCIFLESTHFIRFLASRQIHEAIGIAHGGLHSIRNKNIPTMVIRLDFSKSYDLTNWLYLRSILIHVGFSSSIENCFMGYCVNYVSFSISINGVASAFFKPTRGLR
jgi:hypothetical protein